MALTFLYDNGPGLVLNTGYDGDVMTISYPTADSAIVEFNLNIPPLGSVVAGDVVLISKTTDPDDFLIGVIDAVNPGPTIYDASVRIGFNQNVYSLNGSVGYDIKIYSAGDTALRVADFATAYELSAQIESAAYSNRLIKYSNKTTYNLTIDDARRRFFDYAQDIIEAESVFIVDDCEGTRGHAYKVMVVDDTIEFFNNKFRKRINFRVAAV